ncbi:MAG: hypothetical protein ACREQN_18030 [Candidatus Binataceae bacterium]
MALACFVLSTAGTSMARNHHKSAKNLASITGDPTPISSCGTLSAANTLYQLSADITTNTTGDCLVLLGSNIVLDLHNFNITGPGTSASNGAGIRVIGVNDVVEGFNGAVTDFKYGARDQGWGTSGEDLNLTGNGTGLYLNGDFGGKWSNLNLSSNGVGALISRAHISLLEDFSAQSNAGDAVWVKDSDNVNVDFFDVESNGGNGIHVGCATNTPDCDNRNVVVSNSYSDGNTSDGVLLDVTEVNSADRVMNNNASGNSGIDLNDASSSCGGNYWFDNLAGTSEAGGSPSPACIPLNP